MVPNLDGIQKTIDDLNTRLRILETSHKNLSDRFGYNYYFISLPKRCWKI